MTDNPAPPPAPAPAPPPAVVVGALAKLGDRRMADLAEHTPLTDAGRPLLDPDASPRDMIARLADAALWIDANAVLAQALPKREAVWWAVFVARETLPDDADRKQAMTLEAAEAWVRKPNEETRQLALARGLAIQDTNAPAAWSAIAAGWSNGSMAPKSEVEIPAQPWMTATAVFSAVIRACAADPPNAMARLRAALVCGLDIADGGKGRPLLPDTGPETA